MTDWRHNILKMVDKLAKAGWRCHCVGNDELNLFVVHCHDKEQDVGFSCRATTQLMAYGNALRIIGLSRKNMHKDNKPKLTKLIDRIRLDVGMMMLEYPHYLFEMGFIMHPSEIFRLMVFRDKGVICPTCGITGEYFSLVEDRGGSRHLNLYAQNEHGTEVLMTCDHIIPVSKGGTNYKDNLQPMCEPCNGSKSDKVV